MHHVIFEESVSYPIALLIKQSSLNKYQMEQAYIKPLVERGVATKDIIAFSLKYNDAGKAPVRFIREYLEELLLALDDIGTQILYVADSAYFKVLTGIQRTEPQHGYVLPCVVKGFEHFHIVLGINYQSFIYNSEAQIKMLLGIDALVAHHSGEYEELGTGIIHSSHYPSTYEAIKACLENLHQYPALAADIETFSLNFKKAGLGSIAFAWDKNNGVAFPCDYSRMSEVGMPFGTYKPNQVIRALIKEFFETYQGTIIWHNASYDAKVLIYTLWMKDDLDTQGLLEGLEVMTRHVHDTKIIAYLALNSTSEVSYGLKSLAHEYAGNYAVGDINDIRQIPLSELLEYNLVDTLCTWYVFDKHHPMMVRDNQEVIYKTIMLPTMKLLLQTELTGMPMCDEEVSLARYELETLLGEYLAVIDESPIIKTLELLLQTTLMEEANAKLKTKQHPLSHFANHRFNPSSGPQVQRLLYEVMGLPQIDFTDTGQPATGGKTLKKLLNHTEIKNYKEIINALIGITEVTKILSTFIPAFENGIKKADDRRYLHGNYNIGGTRSGRLSSSAPNMQNLPSGSKYGSLIKRAFKAPKGWLMVGADFASLEDRISALTTKDRNKLKVYEDGYDGHSLRAYAYFKDQMPDIEDTVESINSIKDKYPELRELSKVPTFLLTYGGTYHGLINTAGMDRDDALAIEASYHDLYKESDEYVQQRLREANRDGYLDVAFGFRLRTPLIQKVVWESGRSVPYEAQAEARTAGNALGQSYGLLNNRASIAFMEKVWNSKFKYDIKPIAFIHDAQYYLVRDNVEAVEWLNNNLVTEMQWQDLPEIAHDKVKLGAELEIFYPSWDSPIKIDNFISQKEIIEICKAAQSNLEKEEEH